MSIDSEILDLVSLGRVWVERAPSPADKTPNPKRAIEKLKDLWTPGELDEMDRRFREGPSVEELKAQTLMGAIECQFYSAALTIYGIRCERRKHDKYGHEPIKTPASYRIDWIGGLWDGEYAPRAVRRNDPRERFEFEDLRIKRAVWDRIVIELSGVADEAPGLPGTGTPGASHTDQAGESEIDTANARKHQALTEWIFAKHPRDDSRRLTFNELLDAARHTRELVPSPTHRKFSEAYRAVYESKPNAPPKAGWPLREPYSSRIKK